MRAMMPIANEPRTIDGKIRWRRMLPNAAQSPAIIASTVTMPVTRSGACMPTSSWPVRGSQRSW